MPLRAALLVALALAACGEPDGASAERPDVGRTPPAAPRGADIEPDGPPPVVFDTTEPAPPPVEIPVRPPPPEPDPSPPPSPPPVVAAPGSCDVRETESFCFAYTGSGWTDADARDQCGEAPASTYRRGACPVAGRVATCTFRRPSDPTLEVVYTYYAPYNLGLAEVACPGEFERVP